MYSTKGVVEGGGNEFIKPGIVENVTVKGITVPDVEEGKAPYILIDMVSGLGDKGDFKFYFSEKAAPTSLRKLKHMMTKFIDEVDVDSIEAKDLTTYAAKVAKVLVGKTYTFFKFVGKEIEGKTLENGKVSSKEEETRNWMKAEIGLPSFCEVTETSKLRMDKTNKYDWELLPKSDSNPSPALEAKQVANDDLPF